MAVLDFDSHYDQIKGEPTSITVRGETFLLPADIPMVYVILAQQEGAQQRMDQNFYVLMVALFGEDNVNGWLTGGMDREEYVSLLNMVCEHYFSGMGETGDGDPKARKSS